MAECKHEKVGRGQRYEYCLDCGATCRIPGPNQTQEEWHSCAVCRIGAI